MDVFSRLATAAVFGLLAVGAIWYFSRPAPPFPGATATPEATDGSNDPAVILPSPTSPSVAVTAGPTAAPTTIPGVVFQGSGDGRLFAVSTADGKQLWEFNVAQDFDTVNKVPGRGGAIATSGAVVVDGMVYVGTGYAISAAAQGGNVLLAFGVD